MRTVFLLAACLLLLAGRAQADSAQGAINDQARLKMQGDIENCHNQQVAGGFKTHREAAQCINEAIARVYISVHYPQMDLVQVTNAYRIGCAGKMDAGELTESDCNSRMGELRTRVLAEENRRVDAPAKAASGVRPAAGAQSANYGVLLKGLAIWSNGDDEPPAKLGQIVCAQKGPTVSCY